MGGTGGSAEDPDASTVPVSNPGEGRGLSHVVLDFAAVVGVDGSAIAVFEKLRRWARREGTYWAFHQIPPTACLYETDTFFFIVPGRGAFHAQSGEVLRRRVYAGTYCISQILTHCLPIQD